MEDLGVAIQNYLEDTRLHWLEDLRAANADLEQCLKATPKQTETQKNDDGPDEWVPWMHLPWMHLPWMHITFTNAQLLPLDIPQVRQQLRQEVPALAFFLEKLGVDAVACAVSWLNLFVC